MKQTPIHELHNPDLLKFIPIESKKIIEIGCSSGALAREIKTRSPNCDYLGIEIDPSYAELAKRYCNHCLTMDIESASEEFWRDSSERDCWIFGDTLEHLTDPWSILQRIRNVIPQSGVIVACIPNVQHWSVQARLSVGDFNYQESGLMDKTHLRWFTRKTIIEMFDKSGFQIQEGMPRIFNEPGKDPFLAIIKEMAKVAGADSDVAVSDAIPLQYIIKAVPK
jgi:trans-aconitate methyltransferase